MQNIESDLSQWYKFESASQHISLEASDELLTKWYAASAVCDLVQMCYLYEIQIDYADSHLNPESSCFVQTNKAFTSPCPAGVYTGRLMMSTENWDVA